MLSGEIVRESEGTSERTQAYEELSICPLCGVGHDARADLRVHLMTTHNKSELTLELLRVYESSAD